MEVVGAAASGKAVQELAARVEFDLILMDIDMESATAGVKATEAIVAANPNAKITRGEAAVIFAKVFEMYEQVNDVPDGYFTDVPKGSAAYDAVYFLAEAGVCNGMGNGTFGVNATFKRSEVATIVARIAGLVNPAVIAQ
jgi:CheY-like chemotaxis protein